MLVRARPTSRPKSYGFTLTNGACPPRPFVPVPTYSGDSIFHRSMNFFSLKSKADSQEEPLTVVVEGCSPEKGGVGIELNVHNVILELRAGSAAEKGGGLRSGDRVVAIDGEQLNYRQLAEVCPRALIARARAGALRDERTRCVVAGHQAQ